MSPEYRIDFEQEAERLGDFEKITIPQLMPLLPTPEGKALHEAPVVRFHTKRFVTQWRTEADHTVLSLADAIDFVNGFGIVPNAEVAHLVLENTVISHEKNRGPVFVAVRDRKFQLFKPEGYMMERAKIGTRPAYSLYPFINRY